MSGESHGSRVERVVDVEGPGAAEGEPGSPAGDLLSGTVVGAGASLAVAGTVSLDPEVRIWLPAGAGRGTILSVGRLVDLSSIKGVKPSLLVRTVLRLLSRVAAAAVFLFASARSRRSIVSCCG